MQLPLWILKTEGRETQPNLNGQWRLTEVAKGGNSCFLPGCRWSGWGGYTRGRNARGSGRRTGGPSGHYSTGCTSLQTWRTWSAHAALKLPATDQPAGGGVTPAATGFITEHGQKSPASFIKYTSDYYKISSEMHLCFMKKYIFL